MSPEQVAAAGADLDTLADEAKTTTDRLFDSSEAAARDNEGWLSSPALRNCGQAWHRRLDDLVDRTRQAGADLSGSASSTSAMDREAADRLHDVLTDMAGSGGTGRSQHGGAGQDKETD